MDACQVRSYEVDVHPCTYSDMDGHPHWLSLVTETVGYEFRVRATARYLPSPQVKCY